jgi:hypothetical protein
MIAEGGLRLGFPVWTIANKAVYGEKGLGESIAILTAPDVGRLFPLYTDAEPARQMADGLGTAGIVAVPLHSLKALRSLLERWQRAGVTHVGIDVSGGPGRAGTGRFYFIEDVIGAFPPDHDRTV